MNVKMDKHASSVLIIGGTGALGTALIRAFKELHWMVYATRHSRPVPEQNHPDHWLTIDLFNRDSIQKTVHEAGKKAGSLSAVIHAGGITQDQALVKMNETDWDSVLKVNLSSVLYVAQAAFPFLDGPTVSHFVMVGSMAAKAGHAGQSNYVAAKAGLQGLTQSLAREWGSNQICVNTVWPGVMPSKMTKNLTGKRLESLIQSNSLNKMSDPSESAKFIAFLISQMTQVSGQTFNLDSRLHRWT